MATMGLQGYLWISFKNAFCYLTLTLTNCELAKKTSANIVHIENKFLFVLNDNSHSFILLNRGHSLVIKWIISNKFIHIENKENHLATIYFIILMGEYTAFKTTDFLLKVF